MSETAVRDAKLIQYLNEAHAKEKELETSLGAHITMAAGRKPYQKRLKEHLKETRQHAKLLERRIKKLGGATERVPGLVSRGAALAKGPLHMARGTGEEEKLLKNAKTEYSEEHEEIATYNAIEAFAEKVGDKETAKLARQIRRDEQKMANYLERLIPTLTNAVVTAEVPASERSNGRRSSSRKRSSSSKRSSSRKRTSSKNGRRTSSRAKSRSRSRAKSRS
jgi:ferritin-like metal-binding protein YciE